MLAFQLSGSILLQPVRATAFMTVFGDKTQRDGAKRNRAVWNRAGLRSEREGVTEQIKAQDQMLWVQRMNNICDRAMEIVNHDLIYA